MEIRANYVAVGLFTLIVLAVAFIFVYWVSRHGESQDFVPLDVRIHGSVSGLGPGSDVLFNGIRIGRVTGVTFDTNDPRIVIAHTAVDRRTPIREDTNATLTPQGLTGGVAVELRGGTPDAQRVLMAGEPSDGTPLIEADPSAVADILETARTLATRADRVLSDLEGFVGDNRAPLTEAVANLEVFSKSLADNSPGVEKFLSSISSVSQTVEDFSKGLDETVTALEKIVKSVDPGKVAAAVENVEKFTAELSSVTDDVRNIVGSVEEAAADIKQFSAGINDTLAGADKILTAIDPNKVRTSLDDIAEMTKGARQVVAEAQKVSSTVAARSEDIDAIISNAQQVSERLATAFDRVDGIVAKLDGLLGSSDTAGLVAEAGSALKEIRKLAATLGSRVDQVANGINNFSNRGLSELQSLVNQSRRSLSKIDRVVSELERDPKSFLLGGGDQVRERSVRKRR